MQHPQQYTLQTELKLFLLSLRSSSDDLLMLLVQISFLLKIWAGLDKPSAQPDIKVALLVYSPSSKLSLLPCPILLQSMVFSHSLPWWATLLYHDCKQWTVGSTAGNLSRAKTTWNISPWRNNEDMKRNDKSLGLVLQQLCLNAWKWRRLSQSSSSVTSMCVL